MTCYRPIPQTDAARPQGALPLAGGWCWFDRVEILERGRAALLIAAVDLPVDVAMRLTAPRPALVAGGATRPALMGILNVTPDSFSDGGQFFAPERALAQGSALVVAGADILDIGGESTRPGAEPVPQAEELARTVPLIAALRAAGVAVPISIDTRKAAVAVQALEAGAQIINDVSALRYDPDLAGFAAKSGVPICLMHAQGEPQTMQDAPHYDNVVLDVYEFLERSVNDAVAAGIARDRIIVDPGIGFGKTVAHNLALVRNLSVLHGLGCPIMLGASRKRFIGTLSGGATTDSRIPGSLAVALAGAAQGAQILRVHDVDETRAALALWRAVYFEENAP